MTLVSNSSSHSSIPAPDSGPEKPNKYVKAALYITIAIIAAAILTALIVCSGAGVVVAGFMFSIGLALDAVAILVGVAVLAIFAAFMTYETYRLSNKAHLIINPPGSQLSTTSMSI